MIVTVICKTGLLLQCSKRIFFQVSASNGYDKNIINILLNISIPCLILFLANIPEEACLTIGHEDHRDFFKIDSIAVSTHIILQLKCQNIDLADE